MVAMHFVIFYNRCSHSCATIGKVQSVFTCYLFVHLFYDCNQDVHFVYKRFRYLLNCNPSAYIRAFYKAQKRILIFDMTSR